MLAHQQCARMSACSTSYGAGSLQAGRARPAAAAALRWQAPGRRAQQQHSRRGVCQIVCVSDVGDDDFETEILQVGPPWGWGWGWEWPLRLCAALPALPVVPD